METKLTTYLFYTALIFSLITMLFCIVIFHKNTENETYKMLDEYCTQISEKLTEENFDKIASYLPSHINIAIASESGDEIYNNLPKEIDLSKKNGKINNNSVSLCYSTLFNKVYICVYTSAPLLVDTLDSTTPYLLIILLFVIIFSVFISITLTDKFMKPINYITKNGYDGESADETYEELQPILNVKTKAEKMKRQFTANVSHELKTPLTSITGYAQLIESQIATGDDVLKFASVINKESQRMLYLVGDILKLSELEEENKNIHFEKVDLYDLSASIIETLEVVAKKSDITLSLSGESTIIDANKNLIYELIYNLCDNAIRYNKPGGSVTVTAKYNSITVADTGIGIDKKYHSRIFERFYRVDKSRSKQTGGTGLGLSIVKHIAEIHSGKINIKSEPDVGTRITVTF